MPADRVHCGPTIVFEPMWMKRSLKIAVGGKQITLFAPKLPNRLPRRVSGPIAPSSTAAPQPRCTISPAARFATSTARHHTVSGRDGRDSTAGQAIGGLAPDWVRCRGDVALGGHRISALAAAGAAWVTATPTS